MELAGLSVAEAVYDVVGSGESNKKKPRILLVCGPGNNGGDGLVAARHLVLFGYDCAVVYPKRSSKRHFVNLVQQCEDFGIDFYDTMPSDVSGYDAIVDAIFGFSFHGEPREPFASILEEIQRAQRERHDNLSVISVDVPSGWNVDEGDVAGTGFVPDVLISLTAPKLCAKSFAGRHYVGGRFLSRRLGDKYGVRMPNYPGVAQVVELPRGGATCTAAGDTAGWGEQYAAHVAEKEAIEFASYAKQKPSEEWEAQYAAYLAEKDANEKKAS